MRRLSFARFPVLLRTYISTVSNIDLQNCAVSVPFLDFYFLIWLCLLDSLPVAAQSTLKKQKRKVQEVWLWTLMLAQTILSVNSITGGGYSSSMKGDIGLACLCQPMVKPVKSWLCFQAATFRDSPGPSCQQVH